jgi:hypothetical protein
MATEQILALFDDDQKAAQSTDALDAAGIKADQWEVLTGVPYPDGAFGEHEQRHHLYVFPFVGAALGLAVALLITIGTQMAYPVVTGGKPLLSLPPMLIVSYEGMLLGAILFTVIGVLFESRLPRPKLGLYDPRITEGLIGILVNCPDDKSGAIQELLRNNGATDIKT